MVSRKSTQVIPAMSGESLGVFLQPGNMTGMIGRFRLMNLSSKPYCSNSCQAPIPCGPKNTAADLIFLICSSTPFCH